MINFKKLDGNGVEGESTGRDDWNWGGTFQWWGGNLVQWILPGFYEHDPSEDS